MIENKFNTHKTAALDEASQSAVRLLLKAEGDPEIGSSDVSCRVYSMYKQYGGFSDDMITELRDEWLP